MSEEAVYRCRQTASVFLRETVPGLLGLLAESQNRFLVECPH